MAKHILIIDDTTDLLRLMRMMLEEDNHKVSVLNSGHGVLQQVRTNRPDLIVLDLLLGDTSGITVLHELKTAADTASIPVVIYTASVLDYEKALQLIANEPALYEGTRVLQKPFALDKLLEIVA